jgi:uncharacterized repeat protein (TIGR01451 family)
MKKYVQLILINLLLAVTGGAQIVRPFTAKYSNPSVNGNIVYLANSITSTSNVGSGNPGTGEPPPAGLSINNMGVGINIDIDNPAPVVKLPFASVWNYHSIGAAPANNPAPTDWRQPAYVLPAAWNVGAAPVAGPGKYGFANPVQTFGTCIPSGQVPICVPANAAKFRAYYFRNNVTFTALELSSTFNNIQLNILRNDGIVVYINGVERFRNTMPAGAVTYATLATANIAPGVAEAVSVNLPTSNFIAGANTIAVEVHLSNTSNRDMSFDMQVLGTSTNGTFNSSSADLNLQPCSRVLFAGLYWGADQGQSGTDSTWMTAGFNTIKLKVPGASSYQTLTSTQTNRMTRAWSAGLNHTGYGCFADITSLINATNANGTYTAADVIGPIGYTGSCAGWTIVIAFSNPTFPPRNLTVFDGALIVKLGSPPIDVNLSGFLTPPSGSISCELGGVVYEGDRDGSDSFSFRQSGSPAFYNLANVAVPLNGAANAWNSKISHKGSVVTTRNPAFQNTLGFDASIFDLPNVGNAQLGNNVTAATVRFSSPSETYLVHVLTTSIAQFTPTFAIEKSATDLNGGSFLPGDSLRYNINYRNNGNDSSTNTIIQDVLPTGSAFIPGSIRIGGVSKTDAPGDDEAEFDFALNRITYRLGVGANSVSGGNIGPGVASSVDFKVVSPSSCKIVSCVGSLRNSARINYIGKISGLILQDSTGINTAGCIITGDQIMPLSGPCFIPKDTLVVNRCNASSLLLPYAKYAGYTFYSAQPFIPANIYNQYIPVTTSGVYWAYFDNGAGCSDTARIIVRITSCPDIDDDNDGIPDYVEFDNALALAGGPIPNWNNPLYLGYVDNNLDLVNDNFDYGADSDNDGIPNFYDTNFPGFTDTNGDGVNDNSDKDLDGIPNQYDLDSDNDGIPDVVESFGVDANGNGVIDNYSDTDNDGLSQNVDGSGGGVNGSGNGLTALNIDNDAIPNYLDLDSDNDGIPDVIEVNGPDVNNSGLLDGFIDANFDGISDSYIVGSGLLRTGADVGGDGRADSYPNKNFDSDLRPNAYDVDSDGDGIVDVAEAGFSNPGLLGWVVGPFGADGWSDVIDAQATLSPRNTDGRGNPNHLDIDSDDDGIPDQIEGQPTANPLPAGYSMALGTDTDNDGLDGQYDNRPALFGGSGILPVNTDGDALPDYMDLDTDADGQPDIIEGNDFNMNGVADDNVTLTLLDTDGDGLDNRFDSSNSTIKGTSYNLTTGGYTAGDPAPGARCPVSRKAPAHSDRAWRFSSAVLPVQFLQFTGVAQNTNVQLNWLVITETALDHFEIERSTNNTTYSKIGEVNKVVELNITQGFSYTDDISNVNSEVFYYRLKVVSKTGEIKYSNIVVVRKATSKLSITIMPNPAKGFTTIKFTSENNETSTLRLIDYSGGLVQKQTIKIAKGLNTIVLNTLSKHSSGMYTVQFLLNNQLVTQKIMIVQ